MSQRHPLAIVAGAATLFAAFPLSTVFASFTWFFYVAIAVVIVVGTAMLTRTVRAPVWVQVLAMLASLLLFVTFVFPSGQEFARLIPTAATFAHFNELFGAAGVAIRAESIPVPDSDGLLLLTTAGVGLVAMLVDLAAVGIRRPALAGLPMLAIYSVPVAVLPDGLSFLPFGFAAAGYLWLLVADSVDRVRRFGRRFTGEGRDVDVWEPSPLSSAGRRLGVVGVAIALVLPLAIPGMTSGLIDRFNSGIGNGDGSGTGTGSNGATVNLTALLKDNLDRDEKFDMVRVTTTDPAPFYLRFGVADLITKDGFVNRAPSDGTVVSRGIGDPVIPKKNGVVAQRYRAEIETLNFNMNLAPTFERLAATQGLDTQWLYDATTDQVYSRRAGASINGKRYSFDYVRVSYTPAALRTASAIPAQDNAREQLQIQTVPQITDLVQQLTAGKSTEYDRVRAIYDHFSAKNGFVYSLSAPGGTSGSAIVDFLTSKKGFCVQYAAAMAWLVRTSGVPARVAFGFTRGGGVTNGTYTLTNFNLHAWTEVFFPDFGWIPFDPTPAGSVSGAVQSSWAPDTSRPDVATTETPDPFERGPTGAPASVSPGAAGNPNAENGAGPGAEPINTWWLVSAAVLVVALFVLFAPAWRRRTLRRRRRAIGGPLIVITRDGTPPPLPDIGSDLVTEPTAVAAARRDAHQAWAELLDTMVDFSVPVDQSETPRATADRLVTLAGGQPGMPSAAAELLARAEERARYAKVPVRSEGLNEAVAATRAGLARRATRSQRLSALLLPRSVVVRWRLGWVTWLGGAVGRAGRIRDVVVSVSPRRLLTRGATR